MNELWNRLYDIVKGSDIPEDTKSEALALMSNLVLNETIYVQKMDSEKLSMFAFGAAAGVMVSLVAVSLAVYASETDAANRRKK